jgi:transcriptional regulator with PAS, ATPase and Fis domain
VLQEREFYPVGGEQPRTTEARVVAATHQHMEELVSEGGFREDLYFRLRVVEIQVPSLRERRGDISLLAEHLLARVRTEIGSSVDKISKEAMACLQQHEWPGNVRELENALIRAAMVARGKIVVPEHLALEVWERRSSGLHSTEKVLMDRDDMSLDSVMKSQVDKVMKYTDGNKTKTAKLLGISRSKLAQYLEEFGL